jgi:hypothetical protein
MWYSETERIGKQMCTPIGYGIHVIAEMIWFGGLLFLCVVPAFLIYKGINGGFHASLFWLLAYPPGFGIVSTVLYQYSWSLALRKHFQYDYERDEASWIEAGKRLTYKYSSDSGPAIGPASPEDTSGEV